MFDEPSVFEQHEMQEPQWIADLARLCSNAVSPLGIIGDYSHKWWSPRQIGIADSDEWVVACYVSPNEIYGGPDDGCRVTVGFDMKVGEVLESFDSIASICWRSSTQYNGYFNSPGLVLRGVFQTHPVSLHLLATPPADAPPALQVDLVTGEHWPKS